MTKKQKTALAKIFVGLVLLIAAIFSKANITLQVLLFVSAYMVLGFDVILKAFRNILKGHVFDENFLMSVATLGAFFIGEYAEAVAVMLFFKIGELFESYAVGKSRDSIAELMDIRPDFANVEQDGVLVQIAPEEVEIGSIITVKVGEKVPIDGIVTEGTSSLDTAALTGESVPREASTGDEIISGCVNLTAVLKIKTTKNFGSSTVSKILDLVENASNKKAVAENFISKFARIYTPCVVFAAMALAFIPPLVFGGNFSEWLNRGLIFLVISCPCALVISVPLSFFGGIGGASKQGILIKGSSYMETLANATTVVFDKTGTLTKGVFEVCEILPVGISEGELLKKAAMAEFYSNHPISLSLKKAFTETIDKSAIGKSEEIAGFGVKTEVNGEEILVGNKKLMEKLGITCDNANTAGTILYVACNGAYCGHIVIADTIKDNCSSALSELKQNGITRCVMLTGDNRAVADAVGEKVGVDEIYAELLPSDKVDHVETLLGKMGKKEKLVFVGDGINDAPVLARADIGVAMGALGSDAAIEAADVVLMQDNLSSLVKAIKISRKTLSIVKQNIVFALLVKAAVMVLGAFGIANMWYAVFADVGVSVLAILNATRALHYSKK